MAGSRAFGAATQAVEMMEATQGGFNWLPPPDAAPTLSGALVQKSAFRTRGENDADF
jgi:hypothetical protein